ncbi:hypothetical protein D9619_008265 [Psilocybe cf. subviscida]|uniref:NACHT domain-containing protein n=1 Tax=Psilocybe cf. subviscida TaxID=2480587 RepID=A0A8H5AUZ8_9AGAR|nr:hypothetical protein D9619_008265 [Psilocybe cf. subviscida]
MPNPSGVNGHRAKNYPPDNIMRETLLKYSRRGLTQTQKLARLVDDHQLDIGLRKLNELERRHSILSARRPLISEETLVQAVIDEAENDIQQNNGPNYIKSKLKNNDIVVPRDLVRKIMAEHFPEGAAKRFPGNKKIVKTHRQALAAFGPYHEVAGDGHEKLGALALDMGGLGLPVYGYRDKWSGTALMLKVVPNCRSPGVVGHLYDDLIQELGGIPLQLNLDKGSEIGHQVSIQEIARELCSLNIDIDLFHAVELLKSVHNIIIEMLWKWLREKTGLNLREVILRGKSMGLINHDLPIHRDLFYWIFVPVVQKSLDEFREYWNQHKVGNQESNGGTYTQVNNNGGNYTQVNNISQRSPWDILQAAAAPSAFHDSDDDDASRCHPNTRVAVINELRDFALRRGDTGHAKIVWMSGAAGAGKSAIARSLCEELSVTNSLLASFFFKRSDPSRNNHTCFVATITYQVYGNVPPQYQSLILGVIEREPLVFKKSVDAQFQALIVTPLRDLFENGYFNTIEKRLIVIDGLDECSAARAQINILTVIQKACKQVDFPFIFIIASRPENEIQAFFRSSSVAPLLHWLELNDSYDPDDDIERFLREKLQETRETHLFKHSIPREWPSNDSIQALVRKSSGQFIYASVVVKYVTSNRRYPHKRLDFVLKLCPPKGDLPFAELDALFSHIFSCVEDIDLALLIIGYFLIADSEWYFSIEWLAHIEELDPDDCLTALCDLWSVLRIEKLPSGHHINILHKSLPDYLCNITRSGKYHIDTDRVLSKRAAKYKPDRYALRAVLSFFNTNIRQLIDNIHLFEEDLMSLSLIKWYNTISSPKNRSEEEKAQLFVDLFSDFFVIFLDWFRVLVHTDYAYLYYHYLDEFRQLIDRHPVVYQWPYLADPAHHSINATALMAVRILTQPSTVGVPVTRLLIITTDGGFGRCSETNLQSLLHDASLKCLKLLEHNTNHSSVADMLRYLTWALPYAAHSSELDAACNPREPLAYSAMGDPTLSNLAGRVATSMQVYRRRSMSMINLSHAHATFNGGNYIQVNNISHKGPWDILQAAVAPSAFHNSDDDDASSCHPNTRVAVINELRDFALRRGDIGHAKVVWLNGAAGAGKSAIARSLCEELSATNSLLASFFFKRSDPSRNRHTSFVATITYQVYGNVPPQYQSLILGVIEHDPLVFNRSVDAQFQALILTPLHDLLKNGYFSTIGKHLIVVDGLDECSTRRAQINILTVIQKISQRVDFPFLFLIASRPEPEIQAFFRSSSVIAFLHRLELNDSYEPDEDIERFLKDKLQETRETHPLKESIPHDWPSNKIIQALVRKSSGQFIYASVVVKYVTSNRRHPHKRLDYALNLCPPKGDLPFAELDALYSHIFSCAEDIELALFIIGNVISDDKYPPSIDELAHINQLDPDDCLAALCDLESVLSIKTLTHSERQFVHILHKSLPDYLCNATRSGIYYIDTKRVLSRRAAIYLQYFQDVRYTPKSTMFTDILAFFNRHIRQLIDNIDSSHEDLRSFSWVKWHNTISSHETRPESKAEFFVDLFRSFFVVFLEWLRSLVQTDYAYLYDHYLDEFRQLTNLYPVVYQWPDLTDPQHRADNITALITVRILTKPSRVSGPVTRIPASASFGGWSQPIILIHDAALTCLNLLANDVNPSSVADSLTYLTEALPYATHSSELYAACGPREPFAYAATGDHGLSDLAERVATAMQNYRKRFANAQ